MSFTVSPLSRRRRSRTALEIPVLTRPGFDFAPPGFSLDARFSISFSLKNYTVSLLMNRSSFSEHVLNILDLGTRLDMLQNVDATPVVTSVKKDISTFRPASEQDPVSNFVSSFHSSIDPKGTIGPVPRFLTPCPDRCYPDPTARREVDLDFRPKPLPIPFCHLFFPRFTPGPASK
jgi:hypothetical protein